MRACCLPLAGGRRARPRGASWRCAAPPAAAVPGPDLAGGQVEGEPRSGVAAGGGARARPRPREAEAPRQAARPREGRRLDAVGRRPAGLGGSSMAAPSLPFSTSAARWPSRRGGDDDGGRGALTAGAWPAELTRDCAGRGQRANRGWRMWIWRPTQGSAPSTSAWGAAAAMSRRRNGKRKRKGTAGRFQ